MNLVDFFEAAITVAEATSAAAGDWPTGSTFGVDCALTAMASIAVNGNAVAGAAVTESRHRRSS